MWELFFQADWIVKSVILILVAASLWSWAIMMSKAKTMFQLKRAAQVIESNFLEGMLESADRRLTTGCPMAHLLYLTQIEYRRIKTCTSFEEKKFALDRLSHILGLHVEEQSGVLSNHLNILGSVGSSAPFVALFGTVWGIMNSFQSIAVSKNTSLAVVAPGIAEALFATAIGFLVAIPAVLGYNRLSSSVQSYSERMNGFAERLLISCMRV